jgi:hypothetical protein
MSVQDGPAAWGSDAAIVIPAPSIAAIHPQCSATARSGRRCRNAVSYSQEFRWENGAVDDAAAQRYAQQRCHLHVDRSIPAPRVVLDLSDFRSQR